MNVMGIGPGVASLASERELDPSLRRWSLLPIQRLAIGPAYALWLGCELGARAMRRSHPSPQENTRRCYEEFFDVLCAETEVWPDYTEGYYPTGDESYEQAQHAQAEFILDRMDAGPRTRLLDLGCGNGRLLLHAGERGWSATGVTISTRQLERCREQGLDVRLCAFEQLEDQFELESFDAIVLNGSMEHFATEQDALDGRVEQIYGDLFERFARLLRPGGRVFISSIHTRVPIDPQKLARHPLRHPVGSYYFYCSLLIRVFSGYYPQLRTCERLAEQQGLRTAFTRDATGDYYLTSKQWSARLQQFVRSNPRFMARFALGHLVRDPRYFHTLLLFWLYDPWTWQFRGRSDSPMVHQWLVFERPR